MKTILIGFDAYDPVIFEKLHSEGKTPHLSAFVESGGYARFKVSNPPQSEVSWTSIATGMNPGQHGIFDFVHRNPSNYGRQVSLLPTKSGLLGREFMPPSQAKTLFDVAADDGYPAVSLWWPATFPARLASPVQSIPGLGTPDILGRLGVGTFFYMQDWDDTSTVKTQVRQLVQVNKSRFKGRLEGPAKRTLTGIKEAEMEFQLEIVDQQAAKLQIEKKVHHLNVGEWSPILELTYKIGFGVSIKAVTRVIVKQLSPEPQLYFVPQQIHPLKSPWPYGTPKKLVKNIWENVGPYLTLGWPQDTTALEEGFISDDQFLYLCDQIRQHREKTLLRLIDTYQEGVLACVFDSIDRIQHMFLRDRPDVIESWYLALDALLGRVLERLNAKKDADDIHLMVVSDHGFGEFSYKVNLNRWLIDHGYLKTNGEDNSSGFSQVDWNQSKAYAVGLNSIYLNIQDREGQGIVTSENKHRVLQDLQDDLSDWIGPDGRTVVQSAPVQGEAFQGPFTPYGPDLLVGYRPGYRASSETGLGQWGDQAIEPNRDHWGADHCFDADAVPGVLFSNQGLKDLPNPYYADIPMLAINKTIAPDDRVVPPTVSDEDQEAIEERLKGLGYL
jgi:predicted AlkP superfamily phosphohydrolase/phosphomutase